MVYKHYSGSLQALYDYISALSDFLTPHQPLGLLSVLLPVMWPVLSLLRTMYSLLFYLQSSSVTYSPGLLSHLFQVFSQILPVQCIWFWPLIYNCKRILLPEFLGPTFSPFAIYLITFDIIYNFLLIPYHPALACKFPGGWKLCCVVLHVPRTNSSAWHLD